MRFYHRNILSFIVGGIIGALLLELFYQVVEITLPYHELNPYVGKMMLPSKRITFFEEGFFLGKTNEDGYIGKSHNSGKDDCISRIALIGDSYTEGFHVFEQYHFSQILERELNKEFAEPKYEVLNFGIGNYNYNDMVILYKNFIQKFDCDILVFVVEESDFEFRENFIPSPVLKIINDTLRIDYSFTNSDVYKYYDKFSFLFENSCLVKSVNNAYKLMKKDMIKEIILGKFYFKKTGSSIESQSNKAETRDGLDERIVKSFEWLEDKKTYFVFKDKIPEDFRLNLDKYRVSYISLAPVFEEKITSQGISPNYWDVTNTYGHWNHYTQKIVGETIFQLIRNNEENN